MNDKIVMDLIKTNLKPHKHAGWSWIYEKAKSLGEHPGYARFLADEWARIQGISRDMMCIR